MNKFARILVIIAIWAAVTWVFREKLLPLPKPDDRPPPHFRSDSHEVAGGPMPANPSSGVGAPTGTPHAAAVESPEAPGDTAASPDDLTEVRGIGPVYRHRLGEIGITTFAALAEADVARVAALIDVAEGQVTDWAEQARQLAT